MDDRAGMSDIANSRAQWLTSNGYRLRAQVAHDTEIARRALGAKLGKITRSSAAAYGNRALVRT